MCIHGYCTTKSYQIRVDSVHGRSRTRSCQRRATCHIMQRCHPGVADSGEPRCHPRPPTYIRRTPSPRHARFTYVHCDKCVIHYQTTLRKLLPATLSAPGLITATLLFVGISVSNFKSLPKNLVFNDISCMAILAGDHPARALK